MIEFITYLYLMIAIIAILSLISLGLGDRKRVTYDPFYYILFCFAFYISYLDYKQFMIFEEDWSHRLTKFKKNERRLYILLIGFIFLILIFTGFYIFNLLSITFQQTSLIFFLIRLTVGIVLTLITIVFLFTKNSWKKTKTSSLVIKFLKSILHFLSLLILFIACIFVFNMLTFGASFLIILYIVNLLLPFFISIFFLLPPIAILILYKNISKTSRKNYRILSFTGIFLTVSLALPIITTPYTIIDANNQFAEVFGENWNHFDSKVEEEFLDMPSVLMQAWFGEPELDPTSWKLDAKNVYKETEDYKLKFDVFYPGSNAADHIGKKSTVIYIHGGAWTVGERESGAPYLRYLAAQGYICFTIDYRLLESSNSPDKSFVGDYNIENMMHDIANFTQYLAANENEEEVHDADLDNVFIIGKSAGAYLAGLTGFGYNEDEWDFDDRLKIKGIVLFYPPNDAREFLYGNALYDAGLSKYKTPEKDPEFYELYTPSKHVDEDDPACLIFQGTSDTFVPYEQALQIKKACERDNVDVILITSYFVGHGHDLMVLIKTLALYYIERFFYLLKED